MHTPAIARFTNLGVPPVSFDAAPFFERASVAQLQAILGEMDAGEYGWNRQGVVRYLVDEPGYEPLNSHWETGLASGETLVCEYRRDHVEAWLSRKVVARATATGAGGHLPGLPRGARARETGAGHTFNDRGV